MSGKCIGRLVFAIGFQLDPLFEHFITIFNIVCWLSNILSLLFNGVCHVVQRNLLACAVGARLSIGSCVRGIHDDGTGMIGEYLCNIWKDSYLNSTYLPQKYDYDGKPIENMS